EKAAKNTALFSLWTRFVSGRRKDRLMLELSESLAYIRNIAVLGQAGQISAEQLLSELSEFAKLLSPVFSGMAVSLRQGEKSKAAEALYEALGESSARDIGSFLASWEDIPPAELIQSIDLYRSGIIEARLTKQRRKDEVISDLVYFPVVLNCMVVLLNFLYVAYFLQQKELLSFFF
ncbi:MAG: hypothetical protein IJM08_05075, partial [Firmicutes bacterium]|nr:hypothetical protein [Bacillota bacterium]